MKPIAISTGDPGGVGPEIALQALRGSDAAEPAVVFGDASWLAARAQAIGLGSRARVLLRDLTEHATQPEFVYVHKWKLHDLVMWDNRQTVHRVRRYDQSQPRDMRRATVAGDTPTVAQQAAE